MAKGRVEPRMTNGRRIPNVLTNLAERYHGVCAVSDE